VAGVAAAGGTAFTATGLTRSASASQFIGGTVSQSVSAGGSLDRVVYGFNDSPTNTQINSITLTFSNAHGRTVTVVATGTWSDDNSPGDPDATGFTCTEGDSNVFACSPTLAGGASSAYMTALTNLSVTVADVNP
jgi:hypothetical protein